MYNCPGRFYTIMVWIDIGILNNCPGRFYTIMVWIGNGYDTWMFIFWISVPDDHTLKYKSSIDKLIISSHGMEMMSLSCEVGVDISIVFI